MHMFNSTLGLSQSNPLFISDLRNKNGEGDEPKKEESCFNGSYASLG